MRTSSNLPLRVLTTRTTEPKGRLGCAAVRDSESKRSPLAVLRPLNSGPYQLELPTQVLIGLGGSLRWATKGASITGAMRNIKGTQRIAAQRKNSGRLIVCSLCYEHPKKCSKKTSACQPISALKLVTISFIVNTLAFETASSRPSTKRRVAVGSAKLA